jgi:hypothetical protein
MPANRTANGSGREPGSATWEIRQVRARAPLAGRAAARASGRRIGHRDRYIEGTRLRLRHAEAPHVQYKLSQKEAPAPPDYARAVITTIYLSGKEYEVFAALPASELRKRRHHLCRYSIDVSRRDRIRDGEGNASARRSRLRRQRRVARRPLQGWLAGRERVAIAVIL